MPYDGFHSSQLSTVWSPHSLRRRLGNFFHPSPYFNPYLRPLPLPPETWTPNYLDFTCKNIKTESGLFLPEGHNRNSLLWVSLFPGCGSSASFVGGGGLFWVGNFIFIYFRHGFAGEQLQLRVHLCLEKTERSIYSSSRKARCITHALRITGVWFLTLLLVVLLPWSSLLLG